MKNKQKLSSVYGLHLDETGNFLSGAILGYCQTHTPEEVADLFDNVFLNLDIEKANDISIAIMARCIYISAEVKGRNEIDEYIKKHLGGNDNEQ